MRKTADYDAAVEISYDFRFKHFWLENVMIINSLHDDFLIYIHIKNHLEKFCFIGVWNLKFRQNYPFKRNITV